MLTLTEIFSIIIIHWFADFVLQTDKQAKGKSTSWGWLLGHTTSYSIFTYFGIGLLYLYLFPHEAVKIHSFTFIFAVITFICHTITDYFTSRLNNKLLPPTTVLTFGSNTFGDNEMLAYPKKASWHNFFVCFGFDQVLHYVQLFLTYALLKQYL